MDGRGAHPDDPSPTDGELVTRARVGEMEAFGMLLRRHEAAALRLAAVITGSTDDAPDVVQEAFVKVHTNLGGWRGDGSVRSWLLRVVANQAKNHRRSSMRRLHREHRNSALDISLVDDPAGAAVRSAELAAVAVAITRLPAADREVLGCRYFADLGEAEAAAVLGVPVGTIKSRTSRALERLRVQLRSNEGST